jgi:hypothetical protein
LTETDNQRAVTQANTIAEVYPFLEFSVMLIIFVNNLGPLSVIQYFMMKKKDIAEIQGPVSCIMKFD